MCFLSRRRTCWLFCKCCAFHLVAVVSFVATDVVVVLVVLFYVVCDIVDISIVI